MRAPDPTMAGSCQRYPAEPSPRADGPDDMLVRLAAYEVTHDIGVYTEYGDGTRRGGAPLAQWATTLVLGHLVVQIAGRTGSSRQPVLEGLPGGFHDRRSFSVWPPQPGPVDWPPP